MLRLIDKNIVTAMDDLEITIYNQNNKIVYTNLSHIQQIKKATKVSVEPPFKGLFNLGFKRISFTHFKFGNTYLVEASAVDTYGINELKSLLYIISWVLFFSMSIIIAFGIYNAVWSLKPFKKIIKEVEEIEPSLIKKRISVPGNDEISQLAKAFNTLLDRIEHAFETEKSFISNASHELRTPVTSVLGQVEVALNKSRSEEEYKAILKSVYDDTAQMATIINGFLDLAEANLANNLIPMNPVRVDELIFTIVDNFEKRKPHYSISVDFNSNPETASQLECMANERLLSLMFSNLIDNACKYSGDYKAKVTIDFTPYVIIVSIIDHGIGIPKDELANIFKPMYRGSNTTGKPGHGIGLAIVKKIADLHNASLEIKSDLNIGTTITVRIKI
jgi:signal transduction histidine kinase